VKKYSSNFLAFHNLKLMQFKDETKRSRVAKAIPYDQSALEELGTKLNEVAKKSGSDFSVYGKIKVSIASTPNFSRVLSQPVQIKGIQPKSLKSYLDVIRVPQHSEQVKFTDGSSAPSISGKVFETILYEKDNIYNKIHRDSIKVAISGYISMYATMVLGEEVLNNVNTDIGPGNEQEGIVVYGLLKDPIKITGKFILEKNQTTFR